MIKRIFSALAVAVLCSGMAMAQTASTESLADGPVVIQRSGFGGGFMGGPVPPPGGREMIVRRERGPNFFFRARRMGAWWMKPGVAERIGLSDQQKQQLENIHQDGLLKMIDLRADLEKQEVILAPMMKAYHPDEAQVLAQVDKVSQARSALEKERVQTMLASRNVLTEEQWKKLQDTRMMFHQRIGPRRGFHRSGGMRMQAPPKTPPPSQQ